MGALPVWLAWTQYISPFRYAFEAMTINQWAPIEQLQCNSTLSPTCYKSGADILRGLNFNADYAAYWHDLGLLVALTFLCHIVGYCALYYRVRRAR